MLGTYDKRLRQVGIDGDAAGSQAVGTTWGYDDANRRTGYVRANGVAATIGMDVANRITEILCDDTASMRRIAHWSCVVSCVVAIGMCTCRAQKQPDAAVSQEISRSHEHGINRESGQPFDWFFTVVRELTEAGEARYRVDRGRSGRAIRLSSEPVMTAESVEDLAEKLRELPVGSAVYTDDASAYEGPSGSIQALSTDEVAVLRDRLRRR